VKMSRQVEWVNGETGTSGLSSGDVAIPDFELRRWCQEFIEAARAYASADPDRLEIARERWQQPLSKLTDLQPTCGAGLQAKSAALFALADLLDEHDFRVGALGLALARDTVAFFPGEAAVSSVTRPSRFGLPRPFWFSGKRVTGSRRSQK
jgi:hypothetical protein